MIIGGGPSGSTMATHVNDIDSVIVEEHTAVGSPIQCTGLVHPRVVDMASASETILNTITGFKLFFPGGRVLEVSSNDPKALAIDRKQFDEILSDHAIENGSKLLVSHRFEGFKRVGNALKVHLSSSDGPRYMNTSLLVGADGYKSMVGKSAGLNACRETVRGIQTELDICLEEQDKVEVYIGNNIAPGFFAWVLPCGERTRVGLCVSRKYGTPNQYLTTFLKRRGLDKAKRVELNAGVIPIGPPKKTVTDNILLIGDAAAQVKPLSGGGLFLGMRSAKKAAKVAMNSIAEEDFSERSLSNYEGAWRSELGKEIERGILMRKVFTSMSDKKLDKIGEIMDRDDVKEILATGDIDYPSNLAAPLLKTVPSLIKFSPHVIGQLLRR